MSLSNPSLLVPSSKFSSVFPRISNRLDLLNNGASSVGVINCQCSSDEENIKQKPTTCSNGRWFSNLSLSIRRSRSTYLSLSSARTGYVPPARISISIKRLGSTYPSLSSAGTWMCSASQNISIRRLRSTYVSLSSAGTRICSASQNQYPSED